MAKRWISIRLMCLASLFSLAIATTVTSSVQAFTARNLIHGSVGYDVDELQGRLKLLGYYWGKIDGVFGWKTYWSVRTFQYNFGLPVTGDVDMKTKMMLVKATPNWHPNNGHTNVSNGATNHATQTSVQSTPPSSSMQSGVSGLSASDLNLMAHVVYGEARGEPFVGQVAIAAVILNRIKSSKFPNTVPGVIYVPGAFEAIANGQANKSPNAEAKKAVLDAVKGWDPTHGALFYFNPAKTNNAWMWSRPEICTIGHHIFTD